MAWRQQILAYFTGTVVDADTFSSQKRNLKANPPPPFLHRSSFLLAPIITNALQSRLSTEQRCSRILSRAVYIRGQVGPRLHTCVGACVRGGKKSATGATTYEWHCAISGGCAWKNNLASGPRSPLPHYILNVHALGPRASRKGRRKSAAGAIERETGGRRESPERIRKEIDTSKAVSFGPTAKPSLQRGAWRLCMLYTGGEAGEVRGRLFAANLTEISQISDG